MKGIVRLRLCTSFLLTTAAALVAVQTATAQMKPMPQTEKVSNRALQLAAEGRVTEADKTLEEALAQCRQSGAPPNCAALLSFTRAYLAQQRGRAGLDDARQFYRNVLTTQPSNGAALNNLALVEDSAGNGAEAERLWQQAIQSDPAHAGHYALLLGDHHLRLKNITAALESYELAGQATPEAVAPRRRIVEAYRQMPGTAGLEALESRAEQWERLDPENSRAAYELLLGRWSSGSQSVSAAERSLVRWAALLARNDWLDVGSLGSLLSTWEHPGVHELRDYELDPLSPPRWNWWRGDPDRLGVTFEIARATGLHLLRSAENGPTKAERCWQSALRTVPPDFLAEFPSAVNGYLRVSQELASLYFERPSLDADNTRMGEIVRHLYEGKMAAIERGDWRVTQAFHTTLALIYVARGNWEGAPGTPDYMSARYQLQAVLDDAGRREKSEHFFQPLPEIKGMLAKTLTRTPKRKNEAGPMYFRAALAYLDADSPKDAREMLKAHRELGPPDAAAEQFEQILATRTNPGELSLAAANSAPWLFRASGPLNESFLRRQRFKIYADLAGSSSAEPAQLEAALDAYGLAAEQQTNLVGGGDLLRWQHVEATLLASANAQAALARSPAVKWSVAAPSETSLRITLAGEDRPVAIFLRKETPVAAQVIRAVGAANMRDLQPYLRLRSEGIEIAPAPAGSDLAQLLDRIKRTPNIPLAKKPAIVTPH